MGGAAIATKRLMQALRNDGLDATMLVRDKTSTDPHVVALPGRFQQRFNFLAERAGVWAANGFRRRNLFVVDTAARTSCAKRWCRKLMSYTSIG